MTNRIFLGMLTPSSNTVLEPVTTAMTKLAQNAPYFEEKAPWVAAYKKQAFQPPVAAVVLCNTPLTYSFILPYAVS